MIDVARELGKHFDPEALSYGRARFDARELPCVAPDSIEGFVETVRFAAREKLGVVPVGLGSKLGWCRPPEHADFLLSTRRYTGIVSHVPNDGTIALRAGTKISDARHIAREGGHWLTPDVSWPEHKTLGGVVAAGESGLDRVRFGPVRHHVLGLKVVLADGGVAKCGGQLVKNVTGFDLMHLYCGSHGTLCAILEVALRLFPEPEHELRIELETDGSEQAFQAANAARALPIRLSRLALECHRSPDRGRETWRLSAVAFGRRAAVDHERELLARAWPRAQFADGKDARLLADGDRDEPTFDHMHTQSVHVECLPTYVERVWRACAPLVDGRARLQPWLATIDAGVRDLGGVAALRHELEPLGASVALRNAPSAALVEIEPFAAELPGIELMRDLKRALDPAGVFARGRLHREL